TSGEPPGFEVRGVRIEDEPRSIMIRQGERPALTRPEVTALRNTETRLLRQKGQLMNEKTTLQHAQEGLSNEIHRREELLERGTLGKSGETKVRDDLARSEQQWKKNLKRIETIEAELPSLNTELEHVQAQIGGTYTSEQVFAELEQELEAVPAA